MKLISDRSPQAGRTFRSPIYFEPSAAGEPGNESKRQRQCQRRLAISGLAKRRRCSDYYCERMNKTCSHSLEFNLGTFSSVFTASPQKTLGFNLLNLLLCRTFRLFGRNNRKKVAPDGGEPGRGIAGPFVTSRQADF